jgi:trans-2,3-dihydro-3-hydroxyanthranilate isomerase
MKTLPFGLYAAFTDSVFGGSQAGIVSDAALIDSDTRQRIARELGFPATCFVNDYSNNSIAVRFQSTEKEYPMCGHGTICLMTRMIEMGVLKWQGRERIDVQLCVGSATSAVEICKREDGRAIVMLDIKPPKFENAAPDTKILATLLGINTNDYDNNLPIETAYGDFIHLVVPISDLDAMRRISPDFFGLKQFCLKNSIDTVAVFCREAIQSDHDIHVRDFCPAVGVTESAAAGTTNAALTSYLMRHDLVREGSGEQLIVLAEQGLEINRPSSIRSVVTKNDGTVNRLQVGGVATKILDGKLYLPVSDH